MEGHGIRIRNIQAASIYEYMNGFRTHMDTTKAMLVNSLFLDYLTKNKLIEIVGESTLSIICLEFGYGTKDYDSTLHNLQIIETSNEKTKNEIARLIKNVETNKSNCKAISRKQLRTDYYKNGVTITYRYYDKNGKEIIKNQKTIHYKMLYRTPGKAKKGTCMFIDSKYYDQVHNFLYMGLTPKIENAPIVELGAYSSLITSSIIDTLKIYPNQILILKDVDSFFKTKVLSVETDEQKQCFIDEKDNYEVSNTMFDGQGLLDESSFPEWADGYVLLRHHMTKLAAFKTRIQQFFKDYYGDKYETAVIKDMWGRDVSVKNIRLITTNNAIKWLKFGVSFDYWSSWISKNGYNFGIVKTVHESKLGDVQRMSYQMMNCLDSDSMESVCSKSVNYIELLKTDDNTFLDYLERNKTFSNDFEVLITLCNHNSDFVKSSYFKERKKNIIDSYILNFKNGHSIQNADNLTIVGSPYAMLLHAVGEDPFSDPTLCPEGGTIQCYTERFEDGEYLASFRSPQNARNNIGYLHNKHHPLMQKYFELGRLCIAINMRETCFQDRHNGADQDSDSIYTTNQKDIVRHAKYCYENYPTIVNNIPKDSNVYRYDMEDFARVDNDLASSQLAIGESSNLAQICLTYTYNSDERKYRDYVCILSVLAQVAVDSSKRKFDIDISSEIKRIKNDMEIDKWGLPSFWIITKRDKRKVRNDKQRQIRDAENKRKIREKVKVGEDNKGILKCPMNYIYELDMSFNSEKTNTLPMSDFFIKHDVGKDVRKAKKIERLIQEYSLAVYKSNVSDENDDVERFLLMDDFEKMIKDIYSISFSGNSKGIMSWLINRGLMIGSGVNQNKGRINSTLKKNRSLLLKTLYIVSPEIFLQCFVKKP